MKDRIALQIKDKLYYCWEYNNSDKQYEHFPSTIYCLGIHDLSGKPIDLIGFESHRHRCDFIHGRGDGLSTIYCTPHDICTSAKIADLDWLNHLRTSSQSLRGAYDGRVAVNAS